MNTIVDELRRIAALYTDKDLSGATKAPILGAIADALGEGGISGVWGDGQVNADSFQIPTGTVSAESSEAFIQGVGQLFTFRFSTQITVASPDAESTTLLFEATVPRDVPEDFWAMGTGYIQTVDGSGGYTPVQVEIGPSSEGGKTMAVHVLFPQALSAGTFQLSGYVSGMWDSAGYAWPDAVEV